MFVSARPMLAPICGISFRSDCGRKAMMPIMMISEMPLPMPFSVIRSPSHITNTVPAVRQITQTTVNAQAGMTMAVPDVACRLIA